MQVGKNHKREVSELNHELFLAAKEIMGSIADRGCWHIGWKDVGDFIDYLEENYEIKKKTKINDTKRLDFLLENIRIKDYVTDDRSFCLNEGRESIDSLINYFEKNK